MEHAYIYGLLDPRDKRIYYVGHTINLDSRLNGHIGDTADTPKTRWIADLADLGLRPDVVVLSLVDYASRYTEEYKWIYIGRARGWPLTNTTAMKTEQYNGLASDVDSILVVEIDKGLTWRRLRDVWHDDYKRICFLLCWLCVILTSFTATGFYMVRIGSNHTPYQEWAISIGSIVTLLLCVPFLIEKIYFRVKR